MHSSLRRHTKSAQTQRNSRVSTCSWPHSAINEGELIETMSGHSAPRTATEEDEMLARAIAMSAQEEEQRQLRIAAEAEAERRRAEELAQRRREEELERQRLEDEKRRLEAEEKRRQAEIERQRRMLSSYAGGGYTGDAHDDADLAVAMEESMKSYEEERKRLEQQAMEALRRTAENSPDVDMRRVLSGFSDPGVCVCVPARVWMCVCVCVCVCV